MASRRLLLPAALGAASVLALAGCASASDSSETDAPGDDRVTVVASTNVYGQIVEAIGGDAVDVTSIVASASQDPHSFEPSAQDQLLISRADLIVENGGGYDSFVDALIESSGSTAHVITAAEYSHDWPENEGHEEEGNDEADAATPAADDDHADEGDDHDHDHGDHGHVEGFNEHVWYDPHTVVHVAEAIAEELTELAPDSAETFTANLAEFEAGIEELEASLASLDADYGSTEIFVTEPVPLYLTSAAGLVNVAPGAFTEAVEEGQDVPAATLLEALDLLNGGTVKVVVTNSQTGGAETTAILDDAEAQSIPVVEFAETLPEGQTYLSWMQSNIEALESALEG
ncbi:metal ABC transporter solute-binding protein, Zn/Mn family [Microbacterium sp. SLBN-146]|uniref:metal ABC transporter solute-binding protein, Zn/Mn family n=1 Tax=Microbacterium sp. SLBN-146 TaxID=2768457 RepID=UPI001152E3DB|nr:zinc ABC transporter substrate-binding protein [Microbacterium sp. SLBN-146]TQJ30283.1 zinc/manganese transport system substrate-binding protein [Microbacterium sp. SLBN-146]